MYVCIHMCVYIYIYIHVYTHKTTCTHIVLIIIIISSSSIIIISTQLLPQVRSEQSRARRVETHRLRVPSK